MTAPAWVMDVDQGPLASCMTERRSPDGPSPEPPYLSILTGSGAMAIAVTRSVMRHP
jgi:hypothetical protein